MQDLRTLAEHFREDSGAFFSNEWGLEPRLVMEAWVAQESAWDPYATREEPSFFMRYIDPKLVTMPRRRRREKWGLATSFGLLQVMGVTAREIGFTGRYLAQLTDPSLGLYFGVQYLLKQRNGGDGSWTQALAAYNGGLGGRPDNRTAPYRNQSYVDEIVERAEKASG